MGHGGYKAETEELVPCRADASVMAGVILYIVTRTWCKICRCVDVSMLGADPDLLCA